MPLSAVLFDVDGTLVDTVDLHAASWQRMLAQYGKQVEFSHVRHQIGKGGDQILPVYFSQHEIERFGEQFERDRLDLYQREYQPQARPFPRVRELFQRIRRDGKRIALASSAKQEELGPYLRMLNIADLVETRTTSSDAEQSKPHPDIFQAALAQLGDVTPSEAIVVGDTPYDAIAARRAGLDTIGLLCGGFPEHELRDAGCVAIFRHPAHLLEHYQESPLQGNLAA